MAIDFDGSADDARVQRALRCDDNFRKLVRFRRAQKVTALRAELLAHFFLYGRIANHCLLRSADSAVIKSLARQDVLHGFRNVRGSFDEDGHVAGTDAERRLAR